MISCLVSTPLHTEVRNPSTGENGGENLVQPPILPTEQSLISQHLSLFISTFSFLFPFFLFFSFFALAMVYNHCSTEYCISCKK